MGVDFDKGQMFLPGYQYSRSPGKDWSKEDLVKMIEKVLKTEVNLDFLLELGAVELGILVACIRNRLDQ